MQKLFRTVGKQVVKEMGLSKHNCTCMCAIATVKYFEALQKATNRKCTLMTFSDNEPYCWGHCAVGFYDQGYLYIADLTFPQFDDNAPLVLVERYDKYERRLLKLTDDGIKIKSSDTIKHFLQYTLRGWPSDQKPVLASKRRR